MLQGGRGRTLSANGSGFEVCEAALTFGEERRDFGEGGAGGDGSEGKCSDEGRGLNWGPVLPEVVDVGLELVVEPFDINRLSPESAIRRSLLEFDTDLAVAVV